MKPRSSESYHTHAHAHTHTYAKGGTFSVVLHKARNVPEPVSIPTLSDSVPLNVSSVDTVLPFVTVPFAHVALCLPRMSHLSLLSFDSQPDKTELILKAQFKYYVPIKPF